MVEGLAQNKVDDTLDEALPPPSVSTARSKPNIEHDQHVGEKAGSAEASDGSETGLDPGGKQIDSADAAPSMPDAIASLFAAADPPTFFAGLLGALSRLAGSPDTSDAMMLRLLGRALADGLDEELTFLEIIEALDHKHLRSEGSVAVVAGLLARIISGSSSRKETGEIAELIRTAAEIVREALNSGHARSWHLLPQIAATMARRNAHRNLPLATLAAGLPRLWARIGPVPHDNSTPGSERPWPAISAQPQLMILNGPVEIVILGR
jgi:hypothetical protein